jgi:hypothetical protein
MMVIQLELLTADQGQPSGAETATAEWDQPIDRPQIPEETARLFRERARRIVERNRSLG